MPNKEILSDEEVQALNRDGQVEIFIQGPEGPQIPVNRTKTGASKAPGKPVASLFERAMQGLKQRVQPSPAQAPEEPEVIGGKSQTFTLPKTSTVGPSLDVDKSIFRLGMSQKILERLLAGATSGTFGAAESIFRTPEAVGRLGEYGEKAGIPTGMPTKGLRMLSRGVDIGGKHFAGTSDVADRIAEAQTLLPTLHRAFRQNAESNKRLDEGTTELFKYVQTKGKSGNPNKLRTALFDPVAWVAASSKDMTMAVMDAVAQGKGDKIKEVLKDPGAWAGNIGQAVPSLLMAYASAGSIGFMGWMEGMDTANSAAGFEKETGIPIGPDEYATAVLQSATINAALEKTGYNAVFKREKFGAAGLLKMFVKSGFRTGGAAITEGFTEALQEFNSNLSQRLSFDTKKKILDGVIGSFMGGFGAGGVITGINSASDTMLQTLDNIKQYEEAGLSRNRPVEIPLEEPEVARLFKERGMKQTDTPEFKKWFGDSKVVDENGKPLVVYHGTWKKESFESFNPSAGGAIYFSEDASYASSFAGVSKAIVKERISFPLRVIPAYLEISKPLDMTGFGLSPISRSKLSKFFRDSGIKINEYLSQELDDRESDKAWGYIRMSSEIIDAVKRAGFDGIKLIEDRGDHAKNITATSWVAFEPTQIKSATGNRGTFDPKNPNILYKVSDLGFFSQLERVIEEKMPNSASPDQVRGILKNSGVKQEEMEGFGGLGVNDFLEGKDKISKSDLLDFIRSNNVKVEEVVKEARSDSSERLEHLYELHHAASVNEDYVKRDRIAAEIKKLEMSGDPTKFSSYQLPGGENYKELLLTLPAKKRTTLPKDFLVKKRDDGMFFVADPAGNQSGFSYKTSDEAVQAFLKRGDSQFDKKLSDAPGTFRSSHFDEPNVLAHVRFNDRYIPVETVEKTMPELAKRLRAEGGRPAKVLFEEEKQSDWHQKGRKEGYAEKQPDIKITPTGSKAPNGEIHYRVEVDGKYFGNSIAENEAQVKASVSEQLKINPQGVPNAPFKKTWHELATKRMLRYAVENGYDIYAWTTGEQQAERYDLSKHIGKAVWNEDTKMLTAYDPEMKKQVLQENAAAEDLEKFIGKEAAQKMINIKADVDGDRTLQGLDLKVGGEGMKGFYDQIIPSFLNKYTKKWGGRVSQTTINSGLPGKKLLYIDESGASGMWSVFDKGSRDDMPIAEFETKKQADDYIKSQAANTDPTTVHSLEITPSMKKSVMEGQALFKAGVPMKDAFRAIQEGRALINKLVPGVDHVLKDNLFTDEGKEAVGMFIRYASTEGLIQTVPTARLTDFIHEITHAGKLLFLTEKEQRALENEVRMWLAMKGKNVSSRDIEEFIAQEGEKYFKNREAWIKNNSKLAKLAAFFERIWRLVHNILYGFSRNDLVRLNNFYDALYSGDLAERGIARRAWNGETEFEGEGALYKEAADDGEASPDDELTPEDESFLDDLAREAEEGDAPFGAPERITDEEMREAQELQEAEWTIAKFEAEEEFLRSVGKIKMFRDDFMKEELAEIKKSWFTRGRDGRFIDEIADELGMDDNELIRRLTEISRNRKKKIKDFRAARRLLNDYWKFMGKSKETMKKSIARIQRRVHKLISDEYQGTDLVKRLTAAIKGSKNVRGIQERLYSKERSRRVGKAIGVGQKTRGEKGFHSELGALRGELPRVQFEAIRRFFTQENIDDLFAMIKDHKGLNFFETITARTGLSKLLGESGGTIPTKSEISVLNKVFGADFTQVLLSKRSLMERIKDGVLQALNIPRSVMSSFDLSAPFRQGLFLIGRHKQFWPAFISMFRLFGSKRYFEESQNLIKSDPLHEAADEAGLALTELGVLLDEREEKFMSNWAEKIPLFGTAIKASSRAYVGFLNKLRFDVFRDLYKKAENLGLDPKENKDLATSLAKFINNATGRGDLGGLERAAVALNAFFFSPRLMASRFNMLNPVTYIKMDPFVRKEALKSLFSFVGIGMSVLALGIMGGGSGEDDPRNADFGKLKVRNTRFDIWGGYQQLIRLTAQLISGKIISSTTGKTMTLGEGYRPLTRLDVLSRFFENKEAPIASFISSWLRGESGFGEDFSLKKEFADRFVPMVMQDLTDLAKDDPELLPWGSLGLFGVGVQTYGKRPLKKKSIYKF